jgi:hypothetical protein
MTNELKALFYAMMNTPLVLLWMAFALLTVWCLGQEIGFALNPPNADNAMWFYQFTNLRG